MTEEEWLITQNHIILISRAINELPLDGFISKIDKAETLGPILDPTLFLVGAKKMDHIKQLAQALLGIKKEIARNMFIKGGSPEPG